ncbi:MAG: hypothetical protein JO102_01610, partial [Elusimicrobia bacterium]|nr:hypothetical protein [Elusimicrobiota bacterium]
HFWESPLEAHARLFLGTAHVRLLVKELEGGEVDPFILSLVRRPNGTTAQALLQFVPVAVFMGNFKAIFEQESAATRNA